MMSGQEEIEEVQAALRSASVGRRRSFSQKAGPSSASPQQASVVIPRSLSSTTILLRSPSRVSPNGGDTATEIREVQEDLVRGKELQGDVECAKVGKPVVAGSTAVHVGRAGQHVEHEKGQEIVKDHGPSHGTHRGPWRRRRGLGIWRSSLVELIASLVLTFVSIAGVIACLRADFSYPRIAVAATQFLIYTMCIVAAAPLSGAHLNPSFSFTSILTGHISPLRGLLYMLAQSVGSIFGALFVRAAVPSDIAQSYYLGGCLLKQQVYDASSNTLSSVGADSGPALVAELFFSFLLISVALPLLILHPNPADHLRNPIQALRSYPDPSSFKPHSLLLSSHLIFSTFTDPALIRAAFIIGLLLGLLIFISGQLLSPGYTSAGMNPARCFGPAVAEGGAALWQPQWVFWLGPFLAGLIFAILYRVLCFNYPCRRTDRCDPLHDQKAESIQAKLPLLSPSASSNLINIGPTPSPELDKHQDGSHIDVPRMPSSSMPGRMDVFLHIKATMQNPDHQQNLGGKPLLISNIDATDRSIFVPSFENQAMRGQPSPLVELPLATDCHEQEVILEQGNLSLRNLVELPSSSSSSTLKLKNLFKDTDE